jgi:hypothetical protein
MIARGSSDVRGFETFARRFFLSAIALCALALFIAFLFRGKTAPPTPSGARVEAMLEADQPALIRPVSTIVFTDTAGERATIQTTLPWVNSGKPLPTTAPTASRTARIKRLDKATISTAVGLCKAVKTDLSALRIRSSIDVLAAHNVLVSSTTSAGKCRTR